MKEEIEQAPATVTLDRDLLRDMIQEVAAAVRAKPTDGDQFTPEQARQAEQEVKDEWARQRGEPHFETLIHRMPDDNEETVYIGVNGVPRRFPKGKKIVLPLCALHVLDNAEVSYEVQDVDDVTGQRIVRQVNYLRYPYTKLRELTPEEAEDWRRENAIKGSV